MPVILQIVSLIKKKPVLISCNVKFNFVCAWISQVFQYKKKICIIHKKINNWKSVLRFQCIHLKQ